MTVIFFLFTVDNIGNNNYNNKELMETLRKCATVQPCPPTCTYWSRCWNPMEDTS